MPFCKCQVNRSRNLNRYVDPNNPIASFQTFIDCPLESLQTLSWFYKTCLCIALLRQDLCSPSPVRKSSPRYNWLSWETNKRGWTSCCVFLCVLGRMKAFQQHYEVHIAPLLIHTDLVILKIHELNISPNFSEAYPWRYDLKQRLANLDFHLNGGKSWPCFIIVEYW